MLAVAATITDNQLLEMTYWACSCLLSPKLSLPHGSLQHYHFHHKFALAYL